MEKKMPTNLVALPLKEKQLTGIFYSTLKIIFSFNSISRREKKLFPTHPRYTCSFKAK